MKLLRFLSLFVFLSLGASVWADVSITNVSHQHKEGVSVITVELNGPFAYNSFVLKKPDRLVIDFRNAEIQAGIRINNSTGPIISRIRMGAHGDGRFRLVLDMNAPAVPTFSTGKDDHNNIYRLSIKLSQQLYVVVIDPGHGGKDPGAIGHGGVKEKDLVLDISRRIAKLIDEESGIQAILTRESDIYPSLRKRVDIARRAEADIFLSIHADAFKRSSVRGVSVYSLSEGAASSEMAAYLAQRENAADLAGGVSLSGQDAYVAEVMLDMQLDWKIQESRLLGQVMLDQLGKNVELHNRDVAHAGFVVLKAPAIPSVLIETGYVTNSMDARRLKSPLYQQRLAAAVFRGVMLYCYKRPGCPLPQRSVNHYVVKPGDSLSEIAERLDSQVTTIRRWNGLVDNTIKPRQQLVIPSRTK